MYWGLQVLYSISAAVFPVHVFERFVYSIKSIQMFDVLFGFPIFCLRITPAYQSRCCGLSMLCFPFSRTAQGKNEISACMCALTKVTFLLVQEQRQKMQLWPHKKCPGCAKHIQQARPWARQSFSAELCRPHITFEKSERKYLRSCVRDGKAAFCLPSCAIARGGATQRWKMKYKSTATRQESVDQSIITTMGQRACKSADSRT